VQTVSGFSRNLRKEISKKQKIYFLDLGIRNALIGQFAPLNMRSDSGALWENFLFIERSKLLSNHKIRAKSFFWRLQTGSELDYIEEYEGRISGFEFKFGSKEMNAPSAWLATYPEATFNVINKTNWLSFLLDIPYEHG
jgi:predicted AAA+ superfamily ATPase